MQVLSAIREGLQAPPPPPPLPLASLLETKTLSGTKPLHPRIKATSRHFRECPECCPRTYLRTRKSVIPRRVKGLAWKLSLASHQAAMTSSTGGFPPLSPVSLAPSKNTLISDSAEMANVPPYVTKPSTNRSGLYLARKSSGPSVYIRQATV